MNLKNWLVVVATTFALAACGGGGGSAGTSAFGTGSGTGTGTGTGTGGTGSTGTTTSTTQPTIVVGISSTTVSTAKPATVTATVKTAAGVAASGQVVTFTSTGGLGKFGASTALTDANGVATVQLSPATSTSNGADLVVASVTFTTTPITASIGFSVAGVSASGVPSLSVALSSTAVSGTTPSIILATLKDSAGTAIAGQVVKFSTTDGLGVFNVASALTDSSGVATANLSPATSSTKGADVAVAQATINGTLVTASIGFSVTSVNAPVVGTPTISLSLSTTTVTAATPATVTAVIKDATGAGVAGQVVKFTTVDGLGAFGTTSALSDANGRVTTTLSPVTATANGADQVVATATISGTAVQASQGFQLTASNVSIASFVSDVPTGVSLSAYGQANLTVTVTGGAIGTPVSIALSSGCVAKGKATLTPTSTTTTTGKASFTYRDQGCGATDVADSLVASVSGTTTTVPLSISLSSPTVASVTFISASPQTIFLKGSGLTETSTVIFRVLDTAGNGLPNQIVTLTPSTLSGGLTIDGGGGPITKLSDSLGNVTALINSGTVPTPIRIRATLTTSAGVSIATVSSSLAVAVGLPSQLNFSLAQGTLNIEGFDIDGTANTYTIIASDRLGNPVPANTAVNFITEGGQVEPIKFTTINSSGIATATANFVSSSPRPADGRITILTYALGEESFLDTNGDNVWNKDANGVNEVFQDLGSVYLNRAFDGVYSPTNDQLIPLSIPGGAALTTCNVTANSLLGLDVSIPTVGGNTCDGTWGRAYVRRATETVLSTSVTRLIWNTPPSNLYSSASGALCPATAPGLKDFANDPSTVPPTTIPLKSISKVLVGGGTIYFTPLVGSPATPTSTGSLSFILADLNPLRLNPVAAGSTVTATSTTGLTVTVDGGTPVPSTTRATSVSITYTFVAPVVSGAVTLHVKSPSGVTTDIPFAISATVPPSSGIGAPCVAP